MELPTPLDGLREIATAVRGGDTHQETLRTLLARFGQARRGAIVNQRIANTLNAAELRTEPDFREAGIDELLDFVPAEAPPPPPTDDEPEVTPPAETPTAPTRSNVLYRVARFVTDPKRQAGLVSVAPTATLQEATTLMLANDFSQLPVLGNDRHAVGLFSWKSYGRFLALGHTPVQVRDCMEQPAVEVDERAPVDELIALVQRHEAVLVRAPDKRFVTLFTAADLAELYRDLSQDFILLGQIEHDLRALLDRADFTPAELAAASIREAADEVTRVDDLSFGDYLALIGSEGNWARLGLTVDRATFIAELDAVRDIRNAVMHFDPDGLDEPEKARLARVAQFLRLLREATPAAARPE